MNLLFTIFTYAFKFLQIPITIDGFTFSIWTVCIYTSLAFIVAYVIFSAFK